MLDGIKSAELLLADLSYLKKWIYTADRFKSHREAFASRSLKFASCMIGTRKLICHSQARSVGSDCPPSFQAVPRSVLALHLVMTADSKAVAS